MRTTRRELLAIGASTLVAAGIAGCEGFPASTGGSTNPEATVEAAVAAEWNAMRARVWDAYGLGLAGDAGAGARVAQGTFARFEEATGKYSAHEVLEETSEAYYAEWEEALGELRADGLEAGDLGRAREETVLASDQLAATQRALVGETLAQALTLQLLGVTVQNAAFLAAAGEFDAAGTAADDVGARFEEAAVHDALESADSETYAAFEGAVEAVGAAAESEDGDGVQAKADEALAVAIDGSYALVESEAAAGAGHVAALQARGWDAAALASMGGPGTAYAHAAALNVYRARAYDCQWLAAAGETERAATMAGDVFAHFEGSRAHEALEETDHDAYEGFEGGLSDLKAAIEASDTGGVEEAVAAVDENLLTGIGALAGANAPLVEAAFFRARFADARERYRSGEGEVAASIAEGLFGRFEENELEFHETVESTSEEIYHRFEEEHLAGLVDAFANEDDAGVETHYEGVQSAILEFEELAGTVPTISGAEAGYMAARGFDAAALDALGEDERAQAIAQAAFEHFESGAGGYHEAMEEADESIYEAFEERLGGIATNAGDGSDVYPESTGFNEEALASVYAIVGSAGGAHAEAAAEIAQAVFAHFEESRVHDLLEAADRSAYRTFEAQLEAYVTALEEDGDVGAAAESFARASQYAQFALVDGVEQLPLELTLAGTSGGGDSGESEGRDADLEGGPYVVEGVPEGADHVLEMAAVAFEPAELTIQQGETVAWTHAAGEAHTVFAYGDGIPEGATYWASGGFDSQEAAESGWEDGRGAVQSGQSYVHTFQTAGTHEYYCAPHEAAGMVGTIVVE